jgi:uncharacterized protein (DUF952 family)
MNAVKREVVTMVAQWIYHIVPEGELRAGLSGDVYTPARFALDGFVHCSAGPETTLAVARDFHASAQEPVYVLRIDPGQLRARVVYEAPALLPGARTHLQTAQEFPHVYGAIDLVAIRDIGELGKNGAQLCWPERFAPLRREANGWTWS